MMNFRLIDSRNLKSFLGELLIYSLFVFLISLVTSVFIFHLADLAAYNSEDTSYLERSNADFMMDSKPLFTTMILWLILSSVLLDYTEGFLFKESTTRASRRKRTKHQQKKKPTSRETQKKTKQRVQKDASLRKMAIFVLNSWVRNIDVLRLFWYNQFLKAF